MNLLRRLGRGPRQFIRENRRSAIIRLIASSSEKFLRAWYNEGFYEFKSNGEAYALDRFAEWWGPRPAIVWDVGAHLGDWAVAAHSRLPEAHVYSFEIIEPIYQQLASRFDIEPWVTTVNFGLSDTHGDVIVGWNQNADTASSINPRLGHLLFDESMLVPVASQITTGNLFSKDNGRPDLLKIDVEDMSLTEVLLGCGDLLQGVGSPAMIQFEYGDTYIPGNNTLFSIYNLLSKFGYSVGRLYPNFVDFKDYTYDDEHFRMGNYIAVRSNELKALFQ